MLDGIGQLLLLRDLRPDLDLIYHATTWNLPEFVKFINRAKDELVTPDDFDAFVDREQRIFEDRYGSYADAAARLLVNGNLKPVRDVRSAYGRLRATKRGGARSTDPDGADEDRRPRGSANRRRDRGGAVSRPGHRRAAAAIDALADTYVKDGAALEVMRLREIASVYRAYQAELANGERSTSASRSRR